MPREPRDAAAGPGPAAIAAQDPDRLLEGAGLRRTPARRTLLQVLAKATRAMSHADIEAALPEPLDRVTVYRALDAFVEAGLVQRQVGDDRVNRFALFDGVDHRAHSHFHCDDCGAVFCLPQTPPPPRQLPGGFEVAASVLQFRGHCPDCKAAHAPAGSGRMPR